MPIRRRSPRRDRVDEGSRSARALFISGALLSSGCAAKTQLVPAPTAAPVQTTIALATVIHPSQTLPGMIAPYRSIGISSELAEPVTAVNVREGDHVRRGMLLAQLKTDDLEASLLSAQSVGAEDDARTAATLCSAQQTFAQGNNDVRTAQAALARAQITLAAAQHDFTRAQTLAAEGYLPQQTLDQPRTAIDNDLQAVRTARAALTGAVSNARANGSMNAGLQGANMAAARATHRAALVSVEQIARQIARATIVSPVDGVVANVNIDPGEYPSGRQLFTIEENAHVYAILNASSSQAFKIREGAAVTGRPSEESSSFPARSPPCSIKSSPARRTSPLRSTFQTNNGSSMPGCRSRPKSPFHR